MVIFPVKNSVGRITIRRTTLHISIDEIMSFKNTLIKGMSKLLVSRSNIRYLSTQRNVQEVRIPMCLGQLAGKWWGPTNKRPILALHGWQVILNNIITFILEFF